MPLTSRQNVLIMSPELLQKLESANRQEETVHHITEPPHLVTVLEKKLDSAKEISFPNEMPQVKPSQQAFDSNMQNTDENNERNIRTIEVNEDDFNVSEKNAADDEHEDSIGAADGGEDSENSDPELDFAFADDEDEYGDEVGEDDSNSSVADINLSNDKNRFNFTADAHIEHHEHTDTSNNIGLFEVSVDISEHSDDLSSEEENKRDSLTTDIVPTTSRRNSRWSATVLFLASEVQMMVNLAHLSLPDGYEIAPNKVSFPKQF